jgi:hypothetical protein
MIVESGPFKAIVGFMDKYIVKPIVGFFQGIGDFFAYVGSMNLLDLGKAAISGKFGEKEAEFAGARQIMRLKDSGELAAYATEKKLFTASGSLKLQDAATAYAAENGIALPSDFSIFKKYHKGGLAAYEQPAILRKDERVLSPYQTRMFDDLNTRADLALRQTMAESQNKMLDAQIQTQTTLTKALDKLSKALEGMGGNSVSAQNVTQNFSSPFRAENLLKSLTLEVS